MTVEIKPEDERLIEATLRSGRFDSLEEFVHRAIVALAVPEPTAVTAHPAQKVTFVELFEQSPLKGLDLDFSRSPLAPRPIS